MDRLETIRGLVDEIIAKMQDEQTRKFAYIHTYGVCQATTTLALIRHMSIELPCISAMLHDIAVYAQNCPHKTHAQASAVYAKTLLEDTNLFTKDEIDRIIHTISLHSNKMSRQDDPMSELLKDADTLQHYLYNPKIEVSSKDSYRLYYILESLKEMQTK